MIQWIYVHENGIVTKVINANHVDIIEYDPKKNKTMMTGERLGFFTFHGNVIGQLEPIIRHGNPTAHIKVNRKTTGAKKDD